jgi:predicted extracellular nuclease
MTLNDGQASHVGASFLAVIGALALAVTPANAAPSELFFSEYIEGTSFNKAVEIYNGTGGAVDLAAGVYTLELYSNGSATVSQSMALSGVIADGDVHVVAHPSANPAILLQADQTSGSVVNFNGDDGVVLRKAGVVVDAFGQQGVDPGSQWPGGGQDDTLRRKDAVCAGDTDFSNPFDASVEWNIFAVDTFDGLGSHAVSCAGGASDPVINEFSASTIGSPDVEYVEVFGSPNTDYSAFTVIEIEGDSTRGTIDRTFPVGTTDGSGLWTTAVGNLSVENGSLTLLLVEGFTGSVGNDIDGDDDGAVDFAPWTRIVDDVAVFDGGAGDLTYSVVVLGPNYDGLSSFPPGGASRIPNGTDTDTAGDWVRNDFDLFGIPGFPGSPAVGEAENTPDALNLAITVVTDPLGVCGDQATLIHDIQGSGLSSSDVGSIREIEGVVVGDFQGPSSLNGFFVQEEDADTDGDPWTSEGIFVFDPANSVALDLNDLVRVRGTVSEFNGLTEINNVAAVLDCNTTATATASPVALPVAALDDFEATEGMSVTFPQELVIADYFNFDRFGEIVLTSARHLTPTAEVEPGPDAVAAAQEFLLDRITLDDGRSSQNPDPAIHPNGSIFDLTNLFRGGDTVQNVTGVMDYAFGSYRIQPTQGADYANVNPRTTVPDDVGGRLKVATFNVLNYFTTLDDGVNDICGPAGDQECRGADDANEFTRQRDKIVAAISAIGADVVGLMEIENPLDDTPTADLVAGLNDATAPGTYDYIATGAIGTDAIRVALLYRPAAVTPLGSFAVLDSTVDPAFIDTLNRPMLVQSFAQNASPGAVFTVGVNHLKSKGSDCNAVGDPDTGDGQGNCNLTRTAAAQAIADFMAADPTGSGSGDYLVIGDLNSYDKEDPIDALLDAGLKDLVFEFLGEDAYSYVFDGQTGYLDYQLASPSLWPKVAGATVWHINADEADLIDYDTTFKQPAQDAIYAPDAYRSSDHDTVLVGLFADADGDGVLDAQDVCPGTSIPEFVPTHDLGVNRWALVDDDNVFDTTLPNGGGPGLSFDTQDTGGCSCEQIIEALGLGNGHTRFGCSNGAMRTWVDLVNP